MTSDAAQYEALRSGFGAVWLRRDVIKASGSETHSYLQSQLSQDLNTCAVGATTWSWVLQPHGKVDALLCLTRTAENEYIVDVDAGFADLVIERLERFKLRTKVDFERQSWKVLALRGAAAVKPSGGLVVDVDWNGMVGFDVYGEAPTVPDGATEVDYAVYETTRIEAGLPRMGNELDQLTIPAEAGINDRTISFSKGCYTGQELTARIDSRGGNVPRHLRVVVIDSDELVPIGAKIVAVDPAIGAKPFGTVTSAGFSPRLGQAVALAFVRREVLPGTKAIVQWDDGPSECTIEKAPII